MVVYLSDEGYAHTGVRSNQLHQHLCANVPQQVLDVLPDEGIFHDGLPAGKGEEGKRIEGVGTGDYNEKPAVAAGCQWGRTPDELTASPWPL